MISLGANILTAAGLQIKSVDGLFDFPSIKNEGIDWNDQDYSEVLSMDKDYQYNSRLITIDCFVVGTSWENLVARIDYVKFCLDYDGLRMLKMPSYSNRGYMVRLSKTTIFEPIKLFKDGKGIAEFKIQFEEPQPFNIQFSFKFPTAWETQIQFSIANLSRAGLKGSDKQKYIKVNFLDDSTDVNLEQESFDFDEVCHITGGVPYPVVITGEIDSLESVTLMTGSMEVIGLDTASYFIRNGEISIYS